MAYFSNGTEGAAFDAQCARCRYGEQPCPIAVVQSAYNYDQVHNDLARRILAALVTDAGECQMFKLDPPTFGRLEEA